VYEFDLQEQQPVDLEMGNWFASCHPKSRFIHQLVVARPAADGRHALLDRLYTHRRGATELARRELATVEELRELLADVFGLPVPANDPADAALRRLFA
jgi:N-hydroxyarylamine O-acetyltransferase